jgi:hypothetical protein
LIKRTLFLTFSLLFFIDAIGQYGPPGPPLPSWLNWLPQHRPGPSPSRSSCSSRSSREELPARRWLLTFNALGMLEPEEAFGAGIGYRASKKIEIWSETSLLKNVIYRHPYQLTGIRQVLQVKRSLPRNFFLAAELRYKYYSFRDSTDFFDPVTHDTLSHYGYLSRHLFVGAAVQWGRRYFISKDGKFQLELTIGFGLKDKIFDKVGVPGGYGYLGRSEDLNLERDVIEYRGVIPYLPCSIRFVYSFGKRLN